VKAASPILRRLFPHRGGLKSSEEIVGIEAVNFDSTIGRSPIMRSATPPRKSRRFQPRLERLEPRTTPSTLIYAGNNARGLVYDATRNLLDFTTTAGSIGRYDPVANTLIAPFNVPGAPSLAGIDITPDGSTLVIGDITPGAPTGFIVRMDATTGVSTLLNCSEYASYDVAVMSNTRVLFTSRFNGSGWVNLRELDLTSNGITVRADNSSIRQDTLVSRAADRSRAFFGESNISSGPIFTYSTASNSFGTHYDTDSFLGNSRSGVSRDGSLTALEVGSALSIMNGALGGVESLLGIDGGFVFDPVRDVLYGVNSTTDELIAFDTTTFREKYRVAVGENVPASSGFGPGVAAIDSAGTAVYLVTPTGVRRIDLPSTTGVASRLAVADFPSFLPTGTSGSFTVTALDPAGNVATGFTGTVSFSTSGGSPTLPSNYTFTAADMGQHTFSASFGAGGTWTLTAASAGLTSGTETGIRVHIQPVVSLIPVTDRRGMVYDAARDLLYIATDRGVVERYSPMQRMLLAPWKVGNTLKGIDLTPDGTSLLVADSVRGATSGYIRRVNADTGAVTTLVFSRGGLEGGSYDVVAFANNKALFTSTLEGSGWNPLHEINLATNAITNRTDAGGGVRGSSTLSRGFSRTVGMLTENDISSGPMHTYKTATDAVSAAVNTGGFLGGPHTVNRDGTLIALQIGTNVNILNSSLAGVLTLTGLGGGMVFDPLQDRLYAATPGAGAVIRIYSTVTWLQIGSPFTVADSVSSTFNSEVMAISDDGRWMFITTANGVSAQRLLLATATSLSVAPPSPSIVGQTLTLTATVQGGRLSDRAGELVTFRNGAITLGTAPLNASGVATFMTSTLPVAGYIFNAQYPGDAGYTSSSSANVGYQITALNVTSIGVDSGGIQRSMVRSLTVTFNGRATLGAGAFDVVKLGAGGGPVGLNVTSSVVSGHTVATITFTSSLDPGSSLSDGNYRLTVHADQVTDAAGGMLDGDGDGTPGGDRTFDFFRFYGDVNGDRHIDIADFGVFSGTFNLSTGQTGFLDYLDYNGDGHIDIADFGQFSIRFFTTLPP
jgi:Bacterial Ig-like domain (group 3)/Dockerin type I domain